MAKVDADREMLQLLILLRTRLPKLYHDRHATTLERNLAFLRLVA
jgi:hypothetical protein